MEDKNLTLEQEAQIKEKAAALKAEKKVRKVYPMVVFGDTDCGEKEFYVAYMGEPTFPQFSKFMAASKKDEVNAMRQPPATASSTATRNWWTTNRCSSSV